VYSLHFQYSSVLFPILLASLPDAIDRASGARVIQALGIPRRRMAWTLAWACLLGTSLLSAKFGAFVPNDSFRAGWNPIVRAPKQDHRDRLAKVRELVDSVPADASISSTSGLGPHLSNRRDVYKWPSYREAEYLLLHSSKFDKKDKRRLERLTRRGEFRKIDGGMGIELFERVPEDERKAAKAASRKARKDRGKPDKLKDSEELELEDEEDLEEDIRRRAPMGLEEDEERSGGE
jgi:hypothetical protein